jgi:RimJ/RimL family protein N-acetyltransferase
LRDGSQVHLRPIEPSDKQALVDAFDRLSFQSRYERFLTQLDSMSRSMQRYFTEVDQHDHVALVAFDPETDRMVGVARFVRHNDPEVAEAAITVDDAWQGRGLGTLMLQRLSERAREEGVKRFSAFVLAKNDDMLVLLRRLGPTRVVSRSQGAVEVEAELPRAGVGDQLRELLRMAARLTERAVGRGERPELDSNQRPSP